MPAELSFTLSDPNRRITLSGLRDRLARAGVHTLIDDELGAPVLVGDGVAFVLRPSFSDQDDAAIVFIGLDWFGHDLDILESLGDTLTGLGFTAGPDEPDVES